MLWLGIGSDREDRSLVIAEWWQVPAARADLEHVLSNLNALKLSPPEGDTAYFCDLCEALIGLLSAAARCAVTPEEDNAVRDLRARLERQLGTTIYVGRQAIQRVQTLETSISESLLAEPRKKLAIYGTLAPGEANHGAVAEIEGRWSEGYVRGNLKFTGWGAEYGFPALAWKPDGSRVPVKLLSSHDMERHWPRLDAFEGDEYCRILVPVEGEDGIVAIANLYADRVAMTRG